MMNRREFCSVLGATPFFLSYDGRTGDEGGFAAKSYKNTLGQRMPYQLFIPKEYDSRRQYPLMLWLHGGAGRGNDNLKQISGGNAIGSHVWTLPENQTRNPCFVFAPQCPDSQEWATVADAKPTAQLQLALEVLEEIRGAFSIDARRLYVTGQSLGGFGTWAAVTRRSSQFAGAVPVCGGGDESQASKLRATPIWAFHGEKDQAVPVERSRRMIDAIRKAGGAPKYTEYQDAGHAIWEQVFREPELLSWLFSQRTS
ncbi:MAG TPA: prolyl oligopeptidase family serine peptidase [Blastocatellia bacterium]|nr:prolyl oligopeptidase family serine peptidase [Blastocatellia bacterium]